VRSPIQTTVLQIASRFQLVWGVMNLFPLASRMYPLMLIAWSTTEVIRYSYFVMLLQGSVPDVLSWLRSAHVRFTFPSGLDADRCVWDRYNTFYVLYPLGICSEVWLIYSALEPARSWNHYYEYYLMVVLLIYVPGSLTPLKAGLVVQ
jgi:very-long-chain (3R)-3-hydroxyacyl-CoA dehydratase